MKKHIPTLLVCLILLFQQLPLHSEEAFNTTPFDCTNSQTWRKETFPNSGLVIVRRAQLWLGMGGGTVADFGFALERDRDHTFLFRGNWDHYRDPAGINDQLVDMDFSPDYILLLPGDSLTIYYQCQNFGSTPGTGHVIVNLWMFP